MYQLRYLEQAKADLIQETIPFRGLAQQMPFQQETCHWTRMDKQAKGPTSLGVS